MSKSEEFAYRYIRAAQHPHSDVLRDYVRGRSVAWRQMVLRQLYKWDCVDGVPTGLLYAEPKPPIDFSKLTMRQLATLAETKPHLRNLIGLHAQSRIR